MADRVEKNQGTLIEDSKENWCYCRGQIMTSTSSTRSDIVAGRGGGDR